MLRILRGSGSAIFLHCSANKHTKGCIAIERGKMQELFKNLEAKCTIIIRSI